MLTYDLQAGDQPKYYRLYTCIREDILRAELPPGQKLPSKRALAEHLHISLATVSGAYEQLVDEGYLTAKPRSGYYVSAISLHSVSQFHCSGSFRHFFWLHCTQCLRKNQMCEIAAVPEISR